VTRFPKELGFWLRVVMAILVITLAVVVPWFLVWVVNTGIR
jgi:hypothetical protein